MIKELGYRRSDLVITTKLFFGTRSGPNDTGLSRKQFVMFTGFFIHIFTTVASLRVLENLYHV